MQPELETAERLPVGRAGGRARSPNGGRALPAHRSPTLELRLRADPAELQAARRLAEQAADDYGLDEDARFRLTLAANEAVANAIEHGSPSAEGTVLVRVCGDREGVRFEVRDGGTFSAAVPANDGLAQRGRGIPLMAALADEVDLKPGADGTLVRLLVRGH
jgi:serine/threonine-protein kinase RsbW